MGQIRTASVTWTGDLLTGSGMLNYVSSGVLARLPITWASRTQEHSGRTSPEELLAAAHSSCFSMAFSARLAKNGTPATKLDVTAEVAFDQVDGAWKVTRSTLRVHGLVPGIDKETFDRIAQDARDNCPISKALTGNVELAVETTLLDAAAASPEPRGWQEGTS